MSRYNERLSRVRPPRCDLNRLAYLILNISGAFGVAVQKQTANPPLQCTGNIWNTTKVKLPLERNGKCEYMESSVWKETVDVKD